MSTPRKTFTITYALDTARLLEAAARRLRDLAKHGPRFDHDVTAKFVRQHVAEASARLDAVLDGFAPEGGAR